MVFVVLLPRIIRLRDAPSYLGMKKDYFNKKIRPLVTPIHIGKRGIGFDRLDLDRWIEDHKSRVNSPVLNVGERVWDEKRRQVSLNEGAIGTLTNKSSGNVFAKAREHVNLQKRKRTLQDELKK